MKSKFNIFCLAIILASRMFILDGYTSNAQKLVNPNATPEAKKLKYLLDSLYGKKIISGQAFESVFENWLSIIETASNGKLPAILSLDYMNSTPWRVANGTNPDTTTGMAINWAKKMGGIVEMHWHWDAPSNTNFSTWQGFYTKNTTFDLAKALENIESEDYKLLIRDMDIVAKLIKRLQDSSIAILWRPLHEAEGAWFWWGAKGGNACKSLYRLMYDRFVNHHGLNNLIWVWNSYGKTKENWYPGDDVVDIIAWDYPDYNQANGSWSQYQELFGNKDKIFALGEDGKLIDPDVWENQKWSYFITWAYMIQDPSKPNGKNTAAWVNQVYNDTRVITLDDLVPGPKANAGNSQIIFDHDGDGYENVLLDGSKSFTNSGAIISFVWKKNDIEIANGQKPTVKLNLGVHLITLTVKTDKGETSSANVTITIKAPSLTLNKSFSVSSTEANLGNNPQNAIDGNMNTRWSSLYSDPQWFQVDLGKRYDIKEVVIHWEVASAKNFRIDQSNDAQRWTTVVEKVNMPAGARSDSTAKLSGGARYIRIYGTERTSQWGYSIYEFEVFGSENPNAEPVGKVLATKFIKKNVDIEIIPTLVRANSFITVRIPSIVKNAEIRIFDFRGRKLYHNIMTNNEMIIKLDSGFKNGTYILTINNHKLTGSKKFFIQ
jgi:hypothetical protein